MLSRSVSEYIGASILNSESTFTIESRYVSSQWPSDYIHSHELYA